MNTQTKFRLSLTLQEIQVLVDALSTIEKTSKLRAKLEIYIKKAQYGIVSAGYTAAPRLSISDKLEQETLSPQEKREQAYQLYNKFSGDSTFLSPETILLAKTYMFENGMMTDAEEESFLGE